jgi:hypothetical protein
VPALYRICRRPDVGRLSENHHERKENADKIPFVIKSQCIACKRPTQVLLSVHCCVLQFGNMQHGDRINQTDSISLTSNTEQSVTRRVRMASHAHRILIYTTCYNVLDGYVPMYYGKAFLCLILPIILFVHEKSKRK